MSTSSELIDRACPQDLAVLGGTLRIRHGPGDTIIEDILDGDGRRFLVALRRDEDPDRDQYLQLMLIRAMAMDHGWGRDGRLGYEFGGDLEVVGDPPDPVAKRVRITVSFQPQGTSTRALLTFRAHGGVRDQASDGLPGETEIGVFLRENADPGRVEAGLER